MIKSEVITSVSQIVGLIEAMGENAENMVFRGVSSVKYHLVPSSMRNLASKLTDSESGRTIAATKEQTENLAKMEKGMLADFKRRAMAFIKKPPQIHDDWQWLALAQHHGMPTRLLDWTRHAAVALYFAVEKEDNGGADSAVWCVKDLPDADCSKSPFLLDQVQMFRPQHIDPRVTAQRACFTIHPTDYMVRPNGWLDHKETRLMTIPHRFRKEIRDTLRVLGTHRASVFPDLDGVAAFTKRQYGF